MLYSNCRQYSIPNTTHHQRASVCIQILLDSILFCVGSFSRNRKSAIAIMMCNVRIANTVNIKNLNVSTDLLRIDSTTFIYYIRYTHSADIFQWCDSMQKFTYLNSGRSFQKTVSNSVFSCFPLLVTIYLGCVLRNVLVHFRCACFSFLSLSLFSSRLLFNLNFHYFSTWNTFPIKYVILQRLCSAIHILIRSSTPCPIECNNNNKLNAEMKCLNEKFLDQIKEYAIHQGILISNIFMQFKMFFFLVVKLQTFKRLNRFRMVALYVWCIIRGAKCLIIIEILKMLILHKHHWPLFLERMSYFVCNW